jgi:phosphatidylserine/phosphatidylglycerophosphate/cardiolipin synthase-like enzyme
MGARELEALLQQTLNDPRISAPTRGAIERVFRQRALDPDTVTLFCAQAIVLARAALTDGRMRDTFAWVLTLAEIARDGAPKSAPAPAKEAPPKPAPAPAREPAIVAFSPGDDCLDVIRDEFARAKRKVDVCVFTITDDRIRAAMLDARRRGVAIRVISDNDKSMDEGSDVEPLRRAGIEVRVDETEAHMHHKFAVYDDARVLTGSYNWTRSAANYNQENVVVTPDAAIVGRFKAEFERLWGDFARR